MNTSLGPETNIRIPIKTAIGIIIIICGLASSMGISVYKIQTDISNINLRLDKIEKKIEGK